MPRWALLLFCAAYVLPGFIGRGPWKNVDIASFGYMLELAEGRTDWWQPLLGGMAPQTHGLLPYWLGAWALQLAPAWIEPDLAARIPFIGLLVLTLAATWYGVYCLALGPRAQPVAFAFGGEARPRDYARAVADGGVLALIACLGLAQLSHEVTAYLTQLAFGALAFFAIAASPYRPMLAGASLATGLAGLVLSGAPALAVLFGAGGAALALLEARQEPQARGAFLRWAAVAALASGAAALLGCWTDVWAWRITAPGSERSWASLGRLLLWFTWPTWPLALWTLWRWRRQFAALEVHRHLALPAWFAAIALLATLSTEPADRALLLGLPALAALAAFALPTLSRSVGALVDWFTLLFFTGSAVTIWVIWVAMQTGFPRQPAANVAKLAPGFVASFSWLALLLALAATLAWAWLVRWRIGRHQSALWKSVVLPAGGAALCWLLLMTLWLPLLDYARSYGPQVRQASAVLGPAHCLSFFGFSRAQVAAFQYHGRLRLYPVTGPQRCEWLAVYPDAVGALAGVTDPAQWTLVATIPRPADRNETVHLFRRRF
ncbi:hypothetical protein [Xylophilus sp. ASV27]|uniref:hypothetical protein n=1 Tax=Xylophilus sp. ASV27 TaxID=2795129 RepID=UPI0018EC5937|nr:hypothetical protein [Xylophilus sp. ASV27]